jgi:hypothetical protein
MKWDTTTFSYTVTTSADERALSHWVLQLCTDQLPTGTYSISGTAFVDANGNGVLDVGEALLANVSINLADGSGNCRRSSSRGQNIWLPTVAATRAVNC